MNDKETGEYFLSCNCFGKVWYSSQVGEGYERVKFVCRRDPIGNHGVLRLAEAVAVNTNLNELAISYIPDMRTGFTSQHASTFVSAIERSRMWPFVTRRTILITSRLCRKWTTLRRSISPRLHVPSRTVFLYLSGLVFLSGHRTTLMSF